MAQLDSKHSAMSDTSCHLPLPNSNMTQQRAPSIQRPTLLYPHDVANLESSRLPTYRYCTYLNHLVCMPRPLSTCHYSSSRASAPTSVAPSNLIRPATSPSPPTLAPISYEARPHFSHFSKAKPQSNNVDPDTPRLEEALEKTIAKYCASIRSAALIPGTCS
jgi:hypothetical protein